MFNEFITNYGIFVGVIGMVLALGYTFLYRDRYKTLINDIYIPGNDELRKQLADRDKEIKDLEKDNAALQAQVDEKEASSRQIQKLVSKLPDFSSLTDKLTDLSKQTNENHKQVMLALTEKIDGTMSRKARK